MTPNCKHCEYDLSGLKEAKEIKCPECGEIWNASLMRDFPSSRSFILAVSQDWIRGLSVMIPFSTLLAFIVNWAAIVYFIPAMLILVAGLVVIGLRSRSRVLRITDSSYSVPSFAWSLYSIPTILWVMVYWVAVFVPWFVILD